MAENIPNSVAFHYIKSKSFRVVHCDGVWGGPTPRGYMAISFYSERHPIPRILTHEVTREGVVGSESGRDIRDGIVREVEVEVVMDLQMARDVVKWLQEHIATLENIREQQRGTS